MKTAHGLLAQTLLRAPGREAARNRKRPIGPLTLSASRALGRNLGLGQESHFPPGPRLSPVIVSHPSESNWVSAQTLALIRFSPLPLPHRSEFVERVRWPMRDPARAEEVCPRHRLELLAGVGAHRGWTRHRRVASMASLRVRAHRRGGERRLRRDFNAMRSSTRGAPVRFWVRPRAN
jgi:hypothetical protein